MIRARPAVTVALTEDGGSCVVASTWSRKLTFLALSAPATYEGTWQFLPFMWSNGGDERNLATPKVAAALQFLVDMKNDGSMSDSVVNWSQGDVNDQFKAGDAAMMVNGP